MAFFLPLGVILYHLYQLREPEKNQLFPTISHGFPGWFPTASQVDFHGFPGWFPGLPRLISTASQVDFQGFPGWFPRLPRLISTASQADFPRLPRLMKYDKKTNSITQKRSSQFFLGDLISQVFFVPCCFFWYWKKQVFCLYSPGILPKTWQSSFCFNWSSWGTWVIFSVFDEHSYIQKQHSTTFLVHPSFGTQCSFQGKMDHNRFWLSQEGSMWSCLHLTFSLWLQSNHLSFAMTGPSNF